MRVEERLQERIGFVFIYGAGLRHQIWDQVVSGLEHPVLVVNYPGRKEEERSRQELTLKDYVDYIKGQVGAWNVEKFVIVAHSLGGLLALQIAAEFPGRVVGLAAIGAAIPKRGGSFLSVLPFPKRLMLSILLPRVGTKPPDSAIRTGLCNDLSPTQAEEIIRNFVPESVRLYSDPVDVSIPAVPRLYLKLEKDKEFSPSLQNKMIAHFSPNAIQSLPAGHLPMLSKPEEVCVALRNFLSNINPSSWSLS
ncbi:alpha/beta hydrolase [Paenibacillus filicis]|uniref:Alpha/beta hydrolase n=1 Tax=Paenibacillus gyeongsangnamensis TaxID=3388067 RepID=A0ABT4QEU6_9BACL|nr:alpha/beta hydrolase [Paenibacillus filicis]MCZ8515375.1 alpha/beta hydrolase [Paenibacillus filicis]